MSDRHLVFDLRGDGGSATVSIACSEAREAHDQIRHTLLAAVATCPACLAVQAARVVVLDEQARRI